MKRARSHWTGAVLVCGKCSRKVGGGFGKHGSRSLARQLRRCDGFGKGRKADVGVIETRCLGLCPRGAVTLVDTRRPGEWIVVHPGEDLAPLLARLGGTDA